MTDIEFIEAVLSPYLNMEIIINDDIHTYLNK